MPVHFKEIVCSLPTGFIHRYLGLVQMSVSGVTQFYLVFHSPFIQLLPISQSQPELSLAEGFPLVEPAEFHIQRLSLVFLYSPASRLWRGCQESITILHHHRTQIFEGVLCPKTG